VPAQRIAAILEEYAAICLTDIRQIQLAADIANGSNQFSRAHT
jgi:hypothetical protein